MHSIALICAVPLESAPILSRLAEAQRVDLGVLQGWRGTLCGREVVLIESGMGKTNAAHATTILLERMGASFVVNFGVAGAYAGSGLEVGDVAIAEVEIYGDDGVDGPGGWLSCAEIGIPLLERGNDRFYNHFPVDVELRRRAELALTEAGQAHVVGPFVTVSACSGTARRGTELADRHSAVCETMEGAAIAHVCAAYGVPFLNVRGISNLVEDRDLSRWNLEAAARASAGAVAVIGAAI